MIKQKMPAICLSKGQVMSGLDFKTVKTADAAAKVAKQFGDNNATGILVFDDCSDDLGHDKAMAEPVTLCKAVDTPVIAGGRVLRLEDIKKTLYTGCQGTIINGSKDTCAELLQEGAKRFGKERLYVSIANVEDFKANQEVIEKKSAALILLADIADELSQITDMTVIECADEDYDILKPYCPYTWADFKANSDGLMPVISQDDLTDEVLILAYMNEEAFNKTIATGKMTYWSRSRQELWTKGETSGHLQYVRKLLLDCDGDTILARVKQIGPACHTGHKSCFFNEMYEKKGNEKNARKVLDDVYGIIADRKVNPKEGSYTNYLFDKGVDKILKKVGEECTEIVIAAKNPDASEIKYEISDFLYHVMVLMVEKGVTWEEIADELARR
ncbi:MAG: bifunctional phosphoribosyl-AMP cyclohydrolase/phosphoribosyl-ATP diphosphatase HisIE [Lachnospiraceae bacterium]|nr:bifunctional phosphoribosyl-AMP cyclohydrolase/phosphoribosyl-ATP diphosphatase HisIE [Candidatus Equihabitans merdae]